MKQKTFNAVTALLFLVIAVAHFARIASGWDVVIGMVALPVWASWIALIVALSLAYQGYRLNK